MKALYRTLTTAFAALCSLKPLTVLALMLSISSAQAALIDRGEGFIYDDVLNITWTQDANMSGLETWPNQLDWAAGFSMTHSVYGTFNDWRLPNMNVNNLETFISCQRPGTTEAECRNNEFGYMYYYNGISAENPGPFTNLRGDYYFSGGFREPISDTNPLAAVVTFEFWRGSEGGHYGFPEVFPSDFGSRQPAWAVRDGDIIAAASVVPIPAAVWLFGSAVLGLGWFARTRT